MPNAPTVRRCCYRSAVLRPIATIAAVRPRPAPLMDDDVAGEIAHVQERMGNTIVKTTLATLVVSRNHCWARRSASAGGSGGGGGEVSCGFFAKPRGAPSGVIERVE